jgi:nitrogen fixation protein NifU and related proteins
MSAGLYQGKILDHAMHPRNRGILESADYSHEDAGLVCGDEVRIDVRVKGDRVSEVAFSGQGCAVSQAAASILTEMLATMALDDVKALAEEDLLAAIGVPIGPSRRECALLSLWVLKAGIARGSCMPGAAL